MNMAYTTASVRHNVLLEIVFLPCKYFKMDSYSVILIRILVIKITVLQSAFNTKKYVFCRQKTACGLTTDTSGNTGAMHVSITLAPSYYRDVQGMQIQCNLSNVSRAVPMPSVHTISSQFD